MLLASPHTNNIQQDHPHNPIQSNPMAHEHLLMEQFALLCMAVLDATPSSKRKHDRRRRCAKKADRTKGAESHKRSVTDRKARDAVPRSGFAHMEDDYECYGITTAPVEPPTCGGAVCPACTVCHECEDDMRPVCGVCREVLCGECGDVCHECVENDSDWYARQLLASASADASHGQLASASAALYDTCDWHEEDFGVFERANRYNDYDLWESHEDKKHVGCNTHKKQSRMMREGTSRKSQAHAELTLGTDS